MFNNEKKNTLNSDGQQFPHLHNKASSYLSRQIIFTQQNEQLPLTSNHMPMMIEVLTWDTVNRVNGITTFPFLMIRYGM